MKIGVFDSGVGGKSVANAISKAFPDSEVVFMNDSEHMPYATKTPDEIYPLIVPIFQSLVDQQCDVIVVACNTVTTTLITRLRSDFSVPMIGIEPMIKQAAELTRNGVIAVCATPTTLASERYKWLKENFAKDCTVIEPDCADWSYLIEHNQMDNTKLRIEIESALATGADVIALGCTHYHWIEAEIIAISAGRAQVLQPEEAIVSQLERVAKELKH